MADGQACQATWFASWPLLVAVPKSPTKSGCVTSFVVLQSAVPPDPSPEIRTIISGSQAVSRTQPTMRHGSDFFFVSDRRGTVASMQGPNAGIINILRTQGSSGRSSRVFYFQNYHHASNAQPGELVTHSRDWLDWELRVPPGSPGMTWPVQAREPSTSRGLASPAVCVPSRIPEIRFDAAPSAIPAPTRP